MFCRSICWLICMFVAVSLATVYKNPDYTKEGPVMESVQVVNQVVADDLGNLLDDGNGATVTLVACSTRLVAHRAVLAARSPVLANMLRQYSAEGRGSQLCFPDMEGPVLRQLLAYLYTLQAPRLPDMAPQLLVAAETYGLPALKAACEQQLAQQLSVGTAVATAVLAVNHSFNSLRDIAINFIKVHYIEVLATKGWGDTMVNQSKEAVEVNRLLVGQLAETSAPAATKARTTATTEAGTTATTEAGIRVASLLHSGLDETLTRAAPPHRACPTSPLDEATISRMRSLSEGTRRSRLLRAAQQGTAWEVRALLAAGADVGARNWFNVTALHLAVLMGHAEAASCLLNSGARVDAKDSKQLTPLHYSDGAAVQLLLAKSADPNARDEIGKTPLHYAAGMGRALATAALLEGGADRGARDKWGRTPLDVARENNKPQIIDILTHR